MRRIMNDSNHRDEIVRLEEQIDELAARIESCRKFILAGQIAVAVGGTVLIAIVAGAIQFDPAVMAFAIAAVLGGIVIAGSNRSTAKEAAHELAAAEADRAALIGGLELRLVRHRDS
jgi:L-serine deaminase